MRREFGGPLRKGRKAVLLGAILSVIALGFTNAHAAVTILGTVTGNVTITSPAAGITSTCAATTYSFSGVEIAGDLSDGVTTYTGNVSVSGVLGGSSGVSPFPTPVGCANGLENTSGASGNVNTAASKATFGGSSTPAGHSITGRFWGERSDGYGYIRRFNLVTVKLHVEFCIDQTFANCFPGGLAGSLTKSTTVHVDAQFTPNAFNTSTAGTTGAVFQGSFNNQGGFI
ncbi:MAG: hypothetical protein ABR548_14235 [Actinomycetota bacterium]